MRHLKRLLEPGWRVVKETYTAWRIAVAIFGVLVPAGVVTGVTHFLGEHSVGFLAIVFVLATAAIALGWLAWLGYQQESKRPATAPDQDGDVEWLIRDLFVHVCRDLKRTPDDLALRKQTASEVLDALASGKVAMRGRKIDRPGTRRQPLTWIDAAYWTDVLFTYWFLDEGGSSVDVRNNKTGIEYADLRVDRASALKVWPLPIPIRDAAGKAYERTRGTSMAQAAEAHRGESDGILNHYITSLYTACRVFAQKQPSTVYEEVPVAEKVSMKLWQEGDKMVMGYAAKKIVGYTDPRVSVTDLDAFVEGCKQEPAYKLQY